MTEVSAPERSAPHLSQLDEELERLHLKGHWGQPTPIGSLDPQPYALPYRWAWQDIRALLLRAGELHGIEGGGGRRTVRLCTPGLAAPWLTPTIHLSVQLVKPGEIADAHRHTMSAFRFVIEGRGGYTTVNGVKLRMEPGDLLLTPGACWHDHGHDGDAAMMWIDGHDGPFTQRLNSMEVEPFSQRQQDVVGDDMDMQRRFGALRPLGLRPSPAGTAYVYKGRDALARLQSLGAEARDPRRGYTLAYLDPLSGGPTLPTIQCRLSRLPAAEQTQRFRTSANIGYHVVSGRGATLAGDERLEWETGDMFVVPNWTPHHHIAGTANDVVLLSVSDDPILAAFGLLHAEDV